MIVNFRARGISQSTRKLIHALTLIIIIKKQCKATGHNDNQPVLIQSKFKLLYTSNPIKR
jgi:hypothetical protein